MAASKSSYSPKLNREETRALSKAGEFYDNGLDMESTEGAVLGALAALEVSPLLADAYVTLAIEQSRGDAEALFYWRSGLLAAELALGADAITERRGDFWGVLETRPYMRAKHGLALALGAMGQRAEAVAHLGEMLELNPNDNQGARYALLNLLLRQRQHEQAAGLIVRYEEDNSAQMTWGAALLAFRLGQAEIAARKLAAALESNRHVPAYLLGSKKLPKRIPGYYEMGSTAEAVLYVENCGEAWRETKGALQWLQGLARA